MVPACSAVYRPGASAASCAGKKLLPSAGILIGRPRLGGSNAETWAPSGLDIAPQLRWGSHLAHFFGAGDELRDVLVPYFKAGLENHERCLWVTGRAFNTADARAALGAAVSDLDSRERNRQIEIIDGEQWYSSGAQLRPGELLSRAVEARA